VIARAEQSLASVAAQRKDWAASEHHGRASLEINRLVRGPDHRETAQNRVYLARALREQHRFDEARAELDRARDSLGRSLPPVHVENVGFGLQYAKLAEAQGRFAEAEPLARHSVDGLREIKAPAFRLAFGLGELARIVSHRSPREALPVYDEALTLDVGRDGHDPERDAEELEELARVALAAGQPEFALHWIDRYPGAAALLTAVRAELEHARDARGRPRK
jgi:tetratricopeptide (TPR) repeat protein